jgi:hypothetical protein
LLAVGYLTVFSSLIPFGSPVAYTWLLHADPRKAGT